MLSSEVILERATRHHGLIRISDDPCRARTVRRMAAAGLMRRLLPGVYAIAAVADALEVRVRAVRLWDPNAIVIGRAAAAMSCGVTGRVVTIDVMRAHWTRMPSGYLCHKGRVPVPERVDHDGATRSSSAWTAVWLAAADDGEAIENALRSRMVKPGQLAAVCERMAGTRGQRRRRFVVTCSQHNPWSAAERVAQRALMKAGITGWFGNWSVCVGDATWPIDIAIPKIKLAIEIDGFEFHSDRRTFEWDREKADRLVEEEWTVIRVTWTMLQDEAAFVARIRRAISVASARAVAIRSRPRRAACR